MLRYARLLMLTAISESVEGAWRARIRGKPLPA